VEAAVELRRGEEDERGDEGDREIAVPAVLRARAGEGGLALQERPEPLRLAVGEDERVLDGAFRTVRSAEPPHLVVAEEGARVRLDLDEEDTGGGDGEEVDLVDGAVVGDELDVGPRPVGLVTREPLAHERQGLTFVSPR
jgi:hypothetical protein